LPNDAAPKEKPLLLQAMTVREQHAFYLHTIFSVCWTTKSCTPKNRSGAQSGPQKVVREKTHLEHDLEHKKLHEKTPIWSTIWSTKSSTRKHPSGARFGAQKVPRENTHLEHDLEHKKLHVKKPIWSTDLDHKKLREKTHLEHDLEHKKLHAKTPIWSTIWSTKSSTRKHPSGARFGAQKVARENTVSGARFGAQKVAREEPHLEHDLEHKKLHEKRLI